MIRFPVLVRPARPIRAVVTILAAVAFAAGAVAAAPGAALAGAPRPRPATTDPAVAYDQPAVPSGYQFMTPPAP